jgi:hypothetical protein
MQDTANVTERTTDWHSIDWRKANRIVRGLRRRIFKATNEGNWRKVRSLQKLMLRSYSNTVVSVRKATQENKGRKTAGVDKVLVKTPQARGKMVDDLIKSQSWKPKPVKRVYIPKSNGKQRPLGIPTIKDRCLQAIVKNALEPCWEEQFEDNWLSERGLKLSPEKTKIVHLIEGFDFLGFNIRHYKVNNTKTGYKLLIKPSKQFLKQTRKDIREIFLNYKGKPVGLLIKALNPVIRGKANYMKRVVSSTEFSKLDNYLFLRQVRYVKRTHPNKNKKWTKKRYWGKLNLSREDKWVFGDKDSGAYMLKFSWTKIERHALIKQKHSPDDPKLKEYWEKRSSKRNQSEANRLNRTQQNVAKRQGYKCPVCGESLFNDEPLHLHHIIPRCKGGKDEVRNLIWLHQYCHQKTHYQKK